MRILGIDPGTKHSAFVIWDTDAKKIIGFNNPHKNGDDTKHTEANDAVMDVVLDVDRYDVLAVEMIESFGMPVGREVFITALWIGRYMQAAKLSGMKVVLIPRSTLKLNICNDRKANDSTIRMALMDRHGKPGTKKSPGTTFPLHGDMWQAFAVCVTAEDLYDKIQDIFLTW